MKIEFPKNEDGTLKTKVPCQTPGCDHPNWHVCLDKSDPEHTKVHSYGRVGMSDSHRESISEAQKDRWAEIKAAREKVNAKIVARYRDEVVSTTTLAQDFGVSKTRVIKALKEAEAQGRVKIRPRGRNITQRAK